MIKMKTSTKKKWKLLIPALLILGSLLLNLAGWVSSSFCNCYLTYIFPLWVETYGRIMGILPFSAGEIMLYLAAALIIFFLIWALLRILIYPLLPLKEGKIFRCCGTVFFWIVGVVCVIMTLNCFLLYHVSPINERYTIGANSKDQYSAEEIGILRDYVVERANELSAIIKRDENGNLLYEGDMKQEAKRQMQRLSSSYQNLTGYYPDPKPLANSAFFSQQYIMGYYFPFSMEANYNNIMCEINMPVTMCHELSHLKGFIREDEANFIGYLACVDSEDDFFRYSAYLSVIAYLDRDFLKALGTDSEEYLSHPSIEEWVYADQRFLTEEAWDMVEEGALFDTRTVKAASNAFTETTLVLNGVEDGKISYSRVVDLLLQYYDGILY